MQNKSYILSIKMISKLTILSLVASCLFIFTSCEKDESYGTPRITNVRLTDPATADQTLTQGNLGQMIVIQGENLASATHIFFNSEEAFFLPTMVTNTNIIVSIPREFPTEITDQIRVVTKGGEATYNFPVNIPEPVVEHFPLEWVPEGGRFTIQGSYFYNVESVVFTGGASTTNFIVENPQTILVTIPAEAAPGPVTVNAVAGSSTSKQWFRDNRGMMVDFVDLDICWGGPEFVVDATNIPANVPVTPINGDFYYIKKEYAAETWWIQETVIAYCGDVSVTGPKTNFALVFEMWVGEKWNSNWLEVEMFGSASESPYYHNWRGYEYYGGAEKAMENTGWITVRIPLSDMTGLNGETFRMGRLGSYKAQVADLIEFAIDNIRLVPIN